MEERKVAESTTNEALLHLRAQRVRLARRLNEIALLMVDSRTELETLTEEMKAKVHQLEEVDRGIRALGVDNLSARHAGRFADVNRHPAAFSGHSRNEEEGHR